MTGSAAGIMLLPSTFRRPVMDNRKKCMRLKVYEERQTLNITTNRSEIREMYNCFILNVLESGVRQTETLTAKQTEALE